MNVFASFRRPWLQLGKTGKFLRGETHMYQEVLPYADRLPSASHNSGYMIPLRSTQNLRHSVSQTSGEWANL
jgi:hypothetical protein